MEALAAISLVAAVAQFVDYSHRLLSSTAEIVQSTDGATAEALKTESIVSHVQQLSEALAAPSAPEPSGATIPETEAAALRDLASLCRDECAALLYAIRSVKATGSGRSHYGSFKAALKNAIGAKKLATMQTTIGMAQAAISLQTQRIIGRQIEMIQIQLNASSQTNNQASLQQGQRLDQLRECITQLQRDSQRQSAATDQVVDLAARMVGLMTRSRETTKEVAFLSSLADETMRSRHATVGDAAGGTFEWIWQSGLSQWLESRSSSRVFWIAGKPGSGKSTLMKYIVDHDKLVGLLSKWVAPRDVSVVSHFFWSSGTDMQKSQRGLLQSLIFDFLRQCPSLMPRACPKRWESDRPGVFEASWTIQELFAAIRAIADAPELPVCLCIFIDGLDEYSGDHLDLCQLIYDLSQSPHIKLCVSSRPLNVFRNAFGENTDKTLKVDDFTKKDIRHFAQIRLEGHPRWSHCSLSDSARDSIVNGISNRAEGVFLWVFLVTRSLREGLTDDESIEGLMRRLESLPVDLERLFKNILDGVNPIYHEKMAAMLQSTLQDKYMSLELYYHQDLELERPGYSLALPPGPIAEPYRARIQEQTKRWINARTGGLLDVKPESPFGDRVSFIHRTVRDFLQGKEMTEYLHSKLGERAADPSLRIAKAYSVWAKTGLHLNSVTGVDTVRNLLIPDPTGSNLVHALTPTLKATALVTARDLDSVVELIDDLEDSLVKVYRKLRGPRRHPGDFDARTTFREMVLQTDNAGYLARKLNDGHTYQLRPGTPLLCKVLPMGPFEPYARRVQRVLLEHGHDPNLTAYDTQFLSGWALVVRLLWEQGLGERRETLRSGVLSVYLAHGADPNANTMCWSERMDTGETVYETESSQGVMEEEDEDGRIWFSTWAGGRTLSGVGERCHLSAFAWFLLLHFGEPVMDRETEDRYITLLREFLATGADFNDRILLRYGFGGSEEMPWYPLGSKGSTTIAKEFCHGLREMPVRKIAGARGENAVRQRLFRITREILVAGARCSWDLSELLDVVPSFFSREQTVSLLGVLEPSGAR